ncbi:MAG: three-Cys-motif partner protein TcmP [Planctomycetota bacterium]|nr:three-Cys-motif partner protein TcmP [Planctomycetota bacterium]
MYKLHKPEQPQPDRLITPKVHPWSRDKHHFLHRYLDAFTTAMKDKGWSGLHYIDLFAGAGIEDVDGYGLDWGSPLIAVRQTHQFTRLHLCEIGKKKYEALVERLERYPQPNSPQILRGDANKRVDEVVEEIEQSALSVAFLDPYGLHLDFETLRRLCAIRADLIIFFPDHLDALRNWENVYRGQPDSNLNKVVGTPTWNQRMIAKPRDQWAHVLTQVYVEQIKSLGYTHFDYERITLKRGQPLYRLIFCSKHEAGATIWRRVATKKPGGQWTFDFD